MPKMPGKQVRAPELICERVVKKVFRAEFKAVPVPVRARARPVQPLINIQEREGAKAKVRLRAAMPPMALTPARAPQVLISIQGRTEVRSKVEQPAKVRGNRHKVAANRVAANWVAVLKAADESEGVIQVNR